MLEAKFDRYDSKYCLEQFELKPVNIIGDEAIVAFDLNEEEFEIYMPVVSGEADPVAIEIAKDVMANITEMDNLVQQSNVEECARTGIDSANYEFYLAYVKIEKQNVKLCYYGEKVNTEWDAIFTKKDSHWQKVNF